MHLYLTSAVSGIYRQLIDMDICGEIYKHILRIEPKLLDLKAKDEVL